MEASTAHQSEGGAMTSQEYVKRFLTDHARARFLSGGPQHYPEPEQEKRTFFPDSYRDRVKILALTVLLEAQNRGDRPDWACGDFARFWCLLAEVDHVAYIRASGRKLRKAA